MKWKLSAALLLLMTGATASAHRLDEYLEGTILSVGKDRLEAEITLTPGIAVFPFVIGEIDRDGDGLISEAEQHAYAERVLRDLSLSIDGQSLTPHLASVEFPAIGEMKEGAGEIRIEFRADLPRGGASHKLIFENHHQSRIAAYQVNVLVPRDPAIRIVSQNRNYSQSFYELDFVEAGVPSTLPHRALFPSVRALLGMIAVITVAWLALAWGIRNWSHPPAT